MVATLATPMILQNLITSALGMADIFMVGMLGEMSMAAVTLANIPLFVIQLFIFGVQSGSTVLISQYWGKGDTDSINRVLGVGFGVAGLVSLIGALILYIMPVQFLSMFGNEPTVIALAAEYGRIAGFSWFLTSLSMVYIAAFRAMEKPKLGLYILVASMCCNTFLNWVLIFGNLGAPKMGVEGAALATLISRMLELSIVVPHILCNKQFRMKWRLVVRPGIPMMCQFTRYAGPVILNETMWGFGTAIYPTIMGHMAGSTEILAAYAIVSNVEKLCIVTAMGIASTTAIIIGRDIGAGQPDTVYEKGLAMNTLSAGCGLIVGVLLIVFSHTIAPNWLFPLFKLSPTSQSVATMMLTVLGIVMAARQFNACNIVGVLRGGGDVKWSTIIDTVPLLFIAIPSAAFAALVLRMDIAVVYIVMAVEQLGKAIGGIWRLRSKKWIVDITAKR